MSVARRNKKWDLSKTLKKFEAFYEIVLSLFQYGGGQKTFPPFPPPAR